MTTAHEISVNVGRKLTEIEGVNQTELGNAVGVPGYATTQTLDALEERQLVKRCPRDAVGRPLYHFCDDAIEPAANGA